MSEVITESAEQPPAAPRRKSPLVLILSAVLVLGLAGGGGWYFLYGGAQDPEAVAPAGPALYVPLDPPFVVNFETEQLVRFLQVTVQVMSRDPATVELVKANDPVIRNDLLLLLGNQKYADIATREGKERLRAAALGAVRDVVGAAGGEPERVEAVYFTSFVMQ